MEPTEIIEIVARGEDSKHQFKADINNGDSLAAEMVAFSNSGGGTIYIGISDVDNDIVGLNSDAVARINQLISNAASQNVRPAINPVVENVGLDRGIVMVVSIGNGLSKPYMDKNGTIWVKTGSDKRRANSREEIQRMFQSSSLIHGDEVPVPTMSVADLDINYFKEVFLKLTGENYSDQDIPLIQTLTNMNLMRERDVNIAGALLFGNNLQFKLPAFIVKAICYPGDDISADTYIDSRDISGKFVDIYQQTMSFIMTNIRYIQDEQGINSLGQPEIKKIVFEELVANALIHRDYFISAPIKIFIFQTRIEIISPGHLPNHLKVENIKNGNSNIRNPILASFATRLIPYRGLGTGIRRALNAYPEIDFVDDREENLFKAIIYREQN
ncbi:MAG: RNA-binding domain-containing protein [Victivallaceae bacterium]